MKTALIALSYEGSRVAEYLSKQLEETDLFLHAGVKDLEQAFNFQSIKELSREIFYEYDGLIYVAPCGVVVRAIAPLIRNKATDPAVVVVDVGGRFAVSLLSGHEGGANALALRAANILDAEPVISTTTEALKSLIVGVGCRRGAAGESIEAAIREALGRVGASVDNVRLLASADIKKHEKGLISAANRLGLCLRFISSQEIVSTTKAFQRASFVAAKVGLPAVAEPSALLAGRRTQLILPKSIFYGVTVAIARERCM